jgi:3-hydroxybutyryl-CoA dehydratase
MSLPVGRIKYWTRRCQRNFYDKSFQVTGDLTKVRALNPLFLDGIILRLLFFQLKAGEIPLEGVEANISHVFRVEDTQAFALLTGDTNPIHTDKEYAKKYAGVSSPVVQGMLSSSLFATIFGKTIPGAVYISQKFRWRKPLLVGERVSANVRVIAVKKCFVECETICRKIDSGDVIVEGQAIVLLPKEA